LNKGRGGRQAPDPIAIRSSATWTLESVL
jgi:hypothetical protein